ncbi:MAG TPA: hypothetical protein VK150_03995 [Geothrix sp.]|nr:hypothetical protein [Geothrix sp.]
MRTILAVLLVVLGGLGCARIYRPVVLVAPVPATHGTGLSGVAALQPWGDNGRYERKALQAHLRVIVLTLENTSSGDLEVLRLEWPDATSPLTPEAATTAIKQNSLAYLLYPLVPGLLSLSGEKHSGYGPSDKMVFGGLAIVGLCIGAPNAIIAARSNHRLGAFFADQAWRPGPLRPGQVRRGLLFVRSRDPFEPLPIQVVYILPDGERRLTLLCPGVRPL